MAPSQCVKQRQNSRPRGSASTSGITLAPVPVKPLTVSNQALRGLSWPSRTNGSEPMGQTMSQPSATTAMPSWRVRPARSVRKRKKPTVPMAAPMNMVVANDLTVSRLAVPDRDRQRRRHGRGRAQQEDAEQEGDAAQADEGAAVDARGVRDRNGCAISVADPSARRQEALQARDQGGPREEHDAVALAHASSRRG